MKRLLVLNLLVWAMVAVFAQNPGLNPSASWTDHGSMMREGSFYGTHLVGADSQGAFFWLKPKPSSLDDAHSIVRISSDMSRSSLHAIDLAEGNAEKKLEFVTWLNNEIYVFSSFQNQELKKTFLFAQILDKQSLEVQQDLIKVVELDYGLYNKFKEATYRYELSPDSSKVLLQYALVDRDGLMLSDGLTVLTASMEIERPPFNFKLPSGGVNLWEEMSISNSGDIYVLSRSFENFKEYKNHRKLKRVKGLYLGYLEAPLYSYNLSVLPEGELEFKHYPLKVPGNFVRELSLACDQAGNVRCAGVYCWENSISAVGACSFVLDMEKELVTCNKEAFDLDFILEGQPRKEVSKMKRSYKRNKSFERGFYLVSSPFFREDGGFFLVAEQFDGLYSQNQNDFYYNYLLVISFDKDGKSEWKRKVNRENRFIGSVDVLGSSFSHVRRDDLYLVFQEVNGKSLNAVGRLKTSQAKLVKIGADGELASTVFDDASQSGVGLLLRGAGAINQDELIFPGYNLHNSFRFMRLRL